MKPASVIAAANSRWVSAGFPDDLDQILGGEVQRLEQL
jgi:hypothetical protein